MDLEINNICNELLKNVYKALKQYARFTEFLRYCDPGIRHYIRNYGEEAQDLIYNYK
ncbi:hypothetical protein J6W32_03075 [bacterium]|nr:hypothetical protein [bacterium]